MSVLMINVRVELKFMSPGGLSAAQRRALPCSLWARQSEPKEDTNIND